MEEWRTIEGLGCYEISSEGRIRSLDKVVPTVHGAYRTIRGKLLKPRFDSKGRYLIVDLSNDCGVRKTHLMHRLVCEAFFGKIPTKMEVNHKNGDKKENRISNLEIVTHSENERHKYTALGYKGVSLGRTGSEHAKSKKTIQQDMDGNVIRIYESVREAERATGVWSSCITLCCNGKQRKAGGYLWKYV